MAAITSFHAKKCCHQMSEHQASAGRLCSSVRQFLIYSTFVLVFTPCNDGFLAIFWSAWCVCWCVDAIAAIADREDDSFNAVIAMLGGWPVLDQRWDDSNFDLATVLGGLRRSYGFTPLVLMYVSVDEKNAVAHRILVKLLLQFSSVGKLCCRT